jgi:hypothetical protein
MFHSKRAFLKIPHEDFHTSFRRGMEGPLLTINAAASFSGTGCQAAIRELGAKIILQNF